MCQPHKSAALAAPLMAAMLKAQSLRVKL